MFKEKIPTFKEVVKLYEYFSVNFKPSPKLTDYMNNPGSNYRYANKLANILKLLPDFTKLVKFLTDYWYFSGNDEEEVADECWNKFKELKYPFISKVESLFGEVEDFDFFNDPILEFWDEIDSNYETNPRLHDSGEVLADTFIEMFKYTYKIDIESTITKQELISKFRRLANE